MSKRHKEYEKKTRKALRLMLKTVKMGESLVLRRVDLCQRFTRIHEKLFTRHSSIVVDSIRWDDYDGYVLHRYQMAGSSDIITYRYKLSLIKEKLT